MQIRTILYQYIKTLIKHVFLLNFTDELLMSFIIFSRSHTHLEIQAGNSWTISIGSGVANSISEGDIFIYSCSAQLISFENKSISKEVNCAKHKYMNMSPSLIELATPLSIGPLAEIKPTPLLKSDVYCEFCTIDCEFIV